MAAHAVGCFRLEDMHGAVVGATTDEFEARLRVETADVDETFSRRGEGEEILEVLHVLARRETFEKAQVLRDAKTQQLAQNTARFGIGEPLVELQVAFAVRGEFRGEAFVEYRLRQGPARPALDSEVVEMDGAMRL